MKNTVDGFWVPKKISNDILQLVGELNTLLGGNYFVATLAPTQINSCSSIYQLDYTLWARKNDNKFKSLCIDETAKYGFKEIKAYLLGLTSGLRMTRK